MTAGVWSIFTTRAPHTCWWASPNDTINNPGGGRCPFFDGSSSSNSKPLHLCGADHALSAQAPSPFTGSIGR